MIRPIVLSVLTAASAAFGLATVVSDSVPVLGHYTQNGLPVQRRALENMLMNASGSSRFVDDAKGARAAGNAIGVTIWTVSVGITAAQVVALVEAIEKDDQISRSVERATWPFLIGSEVASFIQGRLYARSISSLRKAVVGHNASLKKNRGIGADYDHLIRKSGAGYRAMFAQDGVGMTTPSLVSVLKEQPAARSAAIRSSFYRELSARLTPMGSTFITFGVVRAIEDRSYGGFLGAGIGMTVFGIIQGVASVITRNWAVDQYNEAIRAAPLEEPSDSTQSPTSVSE